MTSLYIYSEKIPHDASKYKHVIRIHSSCTVVIINSTISTRVCQSKTIERKYQKHYNTLQYFTLQYFRLIANRDLKKG